MMRNGMVAASLVVILAGCGGEDPRQQAMQDARDVAMAERMSKAPFQPIIPSPISLADVARYGLDKPGCTFRKETARGDNQPDPLFIASRDEAFLTIDGELKRYSAKSTAADLPGGVRTSYVGLQGWLDLSRLPDAGTGSDEARFPARLTLHDSQERVAFVADGTMTCTS